MLFLVVSFLCWSPAEGSCSGAIVSISADDMVLSVGDGFDLNCEFTCLRDKHVAQLWRRRPQKDIVSLVNITSMLPNVTLVLSISSATEADAGYYYCMTQPPDTISPEIYIQIADKMSGNGTMRYNLTTSSTPQCDGSRQHRGAGLQGQMWFWILLGKSAVLLLFSLASLAAKYKRG